MIIGTTVTLYEKAPTTTDRFNAPVYAETPVMVDNVLIGEPSTEDIAETAALYQTQIRYMLAIPKGDSHTWEGNRVEWTDPAGRAVKCRVIGRPIAGVEANVPTPWHIKVRVGDDE